MMDLSARRWGACVLFLGLLAAESAWAQTVPPGSAPAAAPAPAQPEAPKDPLGRTTPRGTVRGFLAVAGKGDDEAAVHYLNTRQRGGAALALAHQLFVVLDRKLPARINEISDKPEGSLSIPAEPDEDLIGTIKSDTGDVDIVVERVNRKDAGALWLFSRTTLDEIPELYAEVSSAPAKTGLLKFLLETRIARIPLFHWLVLLVGLPFLHLVGTRLDRFLSGLVGRLLRRLRRNPALPDPEFLPMPVRLLLFAGIIRWMLSAITLPIFARQVWFNISALAAITGFIWLMVRLSSWFEGKIRLRLGRRNLTGALSVLRFVRSAVDGVIIFVGLLVLLYRFGINPTTALAGLGVGGIAIALAAQKTLENVIAGISLISDEAIRVGDFLRVASTLGTVTDIGLRSTRIRTLDRTIVNVPNGQIANASLENLTLRDKFWFHHILCLTCETKVGQIRSILEGITGLLAQQPDVEKGIGHVRLLRFGTSSIDVEVFAYVFARDWPDFLRAQEPLLLQVMDIVESAGARIALPSQMTYLNTSFPRQDGVGVEELAQRLTDEERTAKPKPKRSAAKTLAEQAQALRGSELDAHSKR
jgi:MscS family membrane protein